MVESRFRLLVILAFLILALIPQSYGSISSNLLEIERSSPLKKSEKQFAGTDVRFLSRNPKYTAYYMNSGVVLAGFTQKSSGQEYFEIQIRLQDTQQDAEITTLNPMLDGNEGWLTSLPDYARIKYANVYPRIDMLWSGDQDQLKMQFVIAPGGDPKKIQLQLFGADQIQMTAEGSLQLVAGQKLIEIPKPVAYQAPDESGAKSVVQSRYVIKNKNVVGLELGPYDSRRTIVVVP